MPYTRTLAQLDTAVRTLGQWEFSTDITPFVMFQALNYALIEGYDIMVGKWADYYTAAVNFPIVAGTDTYAFNAIIAQGPAGLRDFYKLRHLDVSADGVRYQRCYPHDLEIAQRYSAVSATSIGRVRYRLQGPSLIFVPVPPAGFGRLFYIPLPVQFTDAADIATVVTFDVPAEERLITYLAMRDLLVRSDLSTQSADGAIERYTAMLRTSADNRDAGEPFYLDPRGPRREVVCDDEDYY